MKIKTAFLLPFPSSYPPSRQYTYRAQCCVSQESSSPSIVTYRAKPIAANPNENLRQLLLRAGAHPHNGGLLITCKGLGTCGTCAVAISNGHVYPKEIPWRENARLSFPPHSLHNSQRKGLRLACQVRVRENIRVDKYSGFWGHAEEQLPDFD